MAKTNGRTKSFNIEKTLEKVLEKAIDPPPPKEAKQIVKSRIWEFVCYTDNPRHLSIIFDIRDGKYPDVTACLHNADYTDFTPEHWDDDGTYHPCEEPVLKKIHCHCIVVLPYKGTKGSVERMFPDLESHLIMHVENPTERYRYLIHMDNPTKHRYNPSDVFGNTERFFAHYHNKENEIESSCVCQILDILDNWDWSQGKVTYSKVIRICCERGLYGHLRKGGSLLANVIKESIEEYNSVYNDVKWVDTNYIIQNQADEIWKLNSALKSANNTIETYKRLVK